MPSTTNSSLLIDEAMPDVPNLGEQKRISDAEGPKAFENARAVLDVHHLGDPSTYAPQRNPTSDAEDPNFDAENPAFYGAHFILEELPEVSDTDAAVEFWNKLSSNYTNVGNVAAASSPAPGAPPVAANVPLPHAAVAAFALGAQPVEANAGPVAGTAPNLGILAAYAAVGSTNACGEDAANRFLSTAAAKLILATRPTTYIDDLRKLLLKSGGLCAFVDATHTRQTTCQITDAKYEATPGLANKLRQWWDNDKKQAKKDIAKLEGR
jgi:hypothetical protein